jgi:branched-chain amino acid transport system substrate-binding protein
MVLGLASFATSAAKPPIKIGFMSSLTGALAGAGSELRDGFLLYLDEIGNKIGDREIEVIVEDDEGNPSVGLNKFRKLVEKDKVPLLAGIFTSGVAYAVRDYVHEQRIPLVICNAGGYDLTSRKASPYLFRASFSNTTTNKYFADYVYDKLGYRKAIIMAQDYPAGWEWVGSFAYYFIRRGGKVVQEFYTKIGTADYAPYITAMDEKKADVLYTMMSGADAIRFNIQYKELGKKEKIPHLTPMNQVDGVVIHEAGEASAGIIFAEPFGDMRGPEWSHFWNLYTKKYKTDLISNFAAHGYVGAMFIVKALQEIKGNIEDKDAFMKALRKTKIDSPIGPKSFDKYQNAVHDVIIMQLKKVDNKFEYVLLQKVPQAGQFGDMSPEEWMKSVPDWGQMRGKWVEYKPAK